MRKFWVMFVDIIQLRHCCWLMDRALPEFNIRKVQAFQEFKSSGMTPHPVSSSLSLPYGIPSSPCVFVCLGFPGITHNKSDLWQTLFAHSLSTPQFALSCFLFPSPCISWRRVKDVKSLDHTPNNPLRTCTQILVTVGLWCWRAA